MNERDKLINKLIKEKGGTREQYLQLLNKIAYHESAGTLDPTLKQYGGGPGRGKYQFEEGKNQGGITAARRTKQYLKEIGETIPKWLDAATTKETLDASKLSSDQQDILFLGNMRKHPKANFKNVWEGKESISDFWSKYHWAGNPKDKKIRVDSFNVSSKKYDDKYKSKPFQKEELPSVNIPTQKQLSNSLPNLKSINKPLSKEVNSKVVDNTYVAPKSEKTYNTNSLINFETGVDPRGNFNNLINYMKFQDTNKKSMGGNISSSTSDDSLTTFKGGGTHEQNSLGGIPQGIGSNGKLNTVEEDETSFDLPDGKFIFSNRINVGTPKDFTSNYIKSPNYRKRLKSSGYGDIDKEIESRLNNVKKTNIIEQEESPSLFRQLIKDIKGEDYSTKGSIYNPNTNNIILDKKQIDTFFMDKDNVAAHEFAHSELDEKSHYSTRLNKYDEDKLTSLLKSSVTDKHSLKPDENKADLNALRYQLQELGYDAGKDEFNETILNKLKGSFIKKRLLKNYSKKNLIWLMNNIAQNTNKNNNTNIA